MLSRLHVLKPDKTDLHSEQHPQNIHTVIRHIQSHRVPASYQQDQYIKRDQIDDKHIPTPSRNHIEVAKSRGQRPGQRTRVHGLHEQVKRQEQGEDGHALVIVRPGDGPRYVPGANRDQRRGDQPGARVPNLLPEEVGEDGRVGGEEGRGQDADFPDVDGEPEEPQAPVQHGGGDHEARVEGAADNAAERVPALAVEPVPELVEPLLGQEQGGPVVEVRVELVDHGLVAEDAEEAGGEGQHVDEAEDGDPDQELLLLGLELEGPEGEVAGEQIWGFGGGAIGGGLGFADHGE